LTDPKKGRLWNRPRHKNSSNDNPWLDYEDLEPGDFKSSGTRALRRIAEILDYKGGEKIKEIEKVEDQLYELFAFSSGGKLGLQVLPNDEGETYISFIHETSPLRGRVAYGDVLLYAGKSGESKDEESGSVISLSEGEEPKAIEYESSTWFMSQRPLRFMIHKHDVVENLAAQEPENLDFKHLSYAGEGALGLVLSPDANGNTVVIQVKQGSPFNDEVSASDGSKLTAGVKLFFPLISKNQPAQPIPFAEADAFIAERPFQVTFARSNAKPTKKANKREVLPKREWDVSHPEDVFFEGGFFNRKIFEQEVTDKVQDLKHRLLGLDTTHVDTIRVADYITNNPMVKELDLKGCKNVTALPENLGELQHLTKVNFGGCHDLKGEVSLPKSLTRLQDGAFENCGLHEVKKAPGLKVVGRGAFNKCRKLERFDIPSVKEIERGGFSEVRIDEERSRERNNS